MRLLAIGGALGVALAVLFLRRVGAPAVVRERVGAVVPRRRTSLEGLTKDELYERAQQADIPGRSEMTKDELLKALRGSS